MLPSSGRTARSSHQLGLLRSQSIFQEAPGGLFKYPTSTSNIVNGTSNIPERRAPDTGHKQEVGPRVQPCILISSKAPLKKALRTSLLPWKDSASLLGMNTWAPKWSGKWRCSTHSLSRIKPDVGVRRTRATVLTSAVRPLGCVLTAAAWYLQGLPRLWGDTVVAGASATKGPPPV